MQFISDILLGAGAIGAAIYCMVLSRRLKRFNQLESGMGGAIAVLSAQVDDMTKALVRAQTTAATSAEQLQALTRRAEQGAERLELMLASLHDLPEPGQPQPQGPVGASLHAFEEASRPRRSLRRRARPDEMEAAE
ncbi:hypothetical protein [Phaeovulum sp. W22_SRMD_FR3]|uniref:hypothetical protein n=1 Tax=Phaeovulum sp. W22_SRMD_FR3 TaxID=3240274 RepID=UPI003F9B9889